MSSMPGRLLKKLAGFVLGALRGSTYETLSLLADDLAACTEQRLLISGLLVDQRQEMIDTFARGALYLQAERQMDGWLAMELARAQSCAGAS